MALTQSSSHLPQSPESLSPSPSLHPANWSSLLQPLSAFPTPPDSIEAEAWELEAPSTSSKPTSTKLHPSTSSSSLSLSTWQTPTITASSLFLTSLLPPSCRPRTPSSKSTAKLSFSQQQPISLLPQTLYRASHLFTPYTIAMAGCILDALSSKFNHTLLQHPVCNNILQPSRATQADLIICTALLIATKFLNDRPPHNIHFAEQVYDGAFSVMSLTVTERLVLEDVNYRLGYLCCEGVVGEKMGLLERFIKAEERKRGVVEDFVEGTGWVRVEVEVLEEGEEERADFGVRSVCVEVDEVEVVEDEEDDVVDEGKMLAVFEMDDDFDYDDDDD